MDADALDAWGGMDELARLDAWWGTVSARVEAGELMKFGVGRLIDPRALRAAYLERRAELVAAGMEAKRHANHRKHHPRRH